MTVFEYSNLFYKLFLVSIQLTKAVSILNQVIETLEYTIYYCIFLIKNPLYHPKLHFFNIL